MKSLFHLVKLRDENGGALIFVAIFMVILLGFAAIVIDGGRLYTEKSKLQKALDAAVLAGAQGLKTSQASSIAKVVSQKNGLALTDGNLLVQSDYSIKATKQIIVPLTFAKVLGINSIEVSATATAIDAPLKKASGIAPIVVEKSLISDSTTVINCGESNPGTLQGNCGYLKSDASNVRDALEKGATYEVGKTVWTDPGFKNGPIDKAIEYLIASDASKPHCQSASTADNECKRVITVVVIEKWEDVNGDKISGTSELLVYGLAAYWIDRYENKKLYGQFIKWVNSPGEVGSGTGIGDYNLYGVKLVE